MAGLTKHYGEVVAVAGIDLEIQAGEFFTMLGPSGSGKTTTLRMIAGFEDPTGGTIELAGGDVSGVPPYDRAVNTVFQDYALFPHMTVGENVAYGLRVARVAKEERAKRRDEALEMVRLPGYGDRKPGELSGGQRQRVALARAIVNRPKVLLLDEPLGALDLKLREQMQVELKSIQGDVGITFVYVTHDQDEALTMSDRIAVFNDGRIEQVSPPVELYEQPATEFVAGFVGVSNVLERDGVALHDPPGEDPAARRQARPPDGLHTERGRVAEVAYAGMVTRYTVDLDAGGDVQLIRQNTESAAQDAGLAGQRGCRGLAPGAHGRRPRELHKRGGIIVRKASTPGTDGVDRHRGPARLHAACWPAAARAAAATSGSSGEALQKVGKGEGELNLISWAGYVEPEWTKPFEAKTGCKVNDKEAGTSDEMVELMKTGQYDGVSASGNATARLVAAATSSTRSTSSLVPNYKTIFPDLKDQPYNTFEGVNYGIPHGRGANLLMWNKDQVKPAPDSWNSHVRPEDRRQVQGQDQRVRRPDVRSPKPPST